MSAVIGTCALCKQEMIRTDDDCWHPFNVAAPCPPESKENGVTVVGFGTFGRPGREFFRAAP